MQVLIGAATALMDGKLRNGWFSDAGLKVYLRCGFHRVEADSIAKCLDIANVEADEPGKGAFTLFLNTMEELVSKHPTVHYVFVESIQNPRLTAFLRERGYHQQVVAHGLVNLPNMFKYFGLQA